VIVLHTGGTLGMVQGPQGLEPRPGMLADELFGNPRFHVQGAPRFTMPDVPGAPSTTYDIVELTPLLDSSNMDVDAWMRVARAIVEHDAEADAFVVIHGTDTMAYAASTLSFALEGLRKTVILTGSQIPFGHVRNDAIDNLLGALVLAARFDLPEVGLYFRDRLLRGNRATKVDATGLDAFASANLRPLVELGVEIDVAWDLVRPLPTGPLRVVPAHDVAVACLRLYPGMTTATIDRILRLPLRGLVLQTYGTGNAPTRRDLHEVLRRASDDGIVIVNVTQCARGTVRPDYAAGRALADAGVVSGLDMTAEAALAKLGWLLSQDDLSADDVRRLVGTDLRGELTPPGRPR
jgi:lysophospholipase